MIILEVHVTSPTSGVVAHVETVVVGPAILEITVVVTVSVIVFTSTWVMVC